MAKTGETQTGAGKAVLHVPFLLHTISTAHTEVQSDIDGEIRTSCTTQDSCGHCSHAHSEISQAWATNSSHICRLGDSWTDKKSICNKFLQSTSVTCLIWPSTRDDVVFGLADGKVKLGQVRIFPAHDRSVNNIKVMYCGIVVFGLVDGKGAQAGTCACCFPSCP